MVDPGRRRAQVTDDRFDSGSGERVDLGPVTGEPDHGVAAGEELPGDRGSDEAGRTGDEAAHQRARMATTPAVTLQAMPTGTIRKP